jgi:hypothetical protein
LDNRTTVGNLLLVVDGVLISSRHFNQLRVHVEA